MAIRGYVRKIINSSAVDGPGNRTAIFLQGCNFDCVYCHNPETIPVYSKMKDQSEVKLLSVYDILDTIEKNKPFIQGVTISGGECSVQFDFLLELVMKLKSEGYEVYVDTNGYININKFQQLLSFVDAFIFDFKVFDSKKHFEITKNHNKIVKRNLKIAAINNQIYEVRTVVLPKMIDNVKNINLISKFLAGINPEIQYKLIKYRPHGVREARVESITPSDQLMQELKGICLSNGLKNIILK